MEDLAKPVLSSHLATLSGSWIAVAPLNKIRALQSGPVATPYFLHSACFSIYITCLASRLFVFVTLDLCLYLCVGYTTIAVNPILSVSSN